MYFVDDVEDNLIFSDTVVALRMMRAQFPHIDKVWKSNYFVDCNRGMHLVFMLNLVLVR